MKDEVPCKGFTLIELSLSMIFIAILSLTVVLLIQNTTASYRRGLVLNQINTVGMDLIDDFRVSVQNASSFPLKEMCRLIYGQDTPNATDCKNDNADSFVRVTKTATVEVTNTGSTTQRYNDMPVFGAFCTGTYTYIWNSGYFENVEGSERRVKLENGTDLSAATLKIGEGDDAEIRDNFRLLKVYDGDRMVCRNAMADQTGQTPNQKYQKYSGSDGYDNSKIKSEFKLNKLEESGDDGGAVVELLKKNDVSDLVLYDLYIAKPALSQTRGNLFLSASIILGTRRGGINIKEAGNSCKPPSDDYSELEYCAINKFNFAVQAGGE